MESGTPMLEVLQTRTSTPRTYVHFSCGIIHLYAWLTPTGEGKKPCKPQCKPLL
jgi:hypothetical protein